MLQGYLAEQRLRGDLGAELLELAIPLHTELDLRTAEARGRFYAEMLNRDIGPGTADSIKQALRLGSSASAKERGAGSGSMAAAAHCRHSQDAPVGLRRVHLERLEAILRSQDYFDSESENGIGGILALQRLMQSLAVWDHHLGFEPSFACFCAKVLPAFELEEDGFCAITGIYKALQLDAYYTPKSTLDDVDADAQMVLTEVVKLWPVFSDIYVRPNSSDTKELLTSLVKDWLGSLFTLVFDASQGEPGEYSFVLKHIMRQAATAKPRGKDRRQILRDLAVAILGRYQKTIEVAVERGVLPELVDRPRKNIHVDEPLIALIERPVAVEACRNFHIWTWASVFSSLGWIVGGQVAAATAVPFACAGLVVGGLAASFIGISEGTVSARQAAQDAVAKSRESEGLLPEVGSERGATTSDNTSPSSGCVRAGEYIGGQITHRFGSGKTQEIVVALRGQAPLTPGPVTSRNR